MSEIVNEQIEIIDIGDLVPDPENARKRTPRGQGAIVESIQSVGLHRSIAIDDQNVIFAGNGTVEGAGEAGIRRVKVIEASGNEIIAVRRRGMTREQRIKAAIMDNQTGSLAEWDDPRLQAQLTMLREAGEDLHKLGFNDRELQQVLTKAITADANSGATAADEAPETHETPISVGDVFALGEHRLMCGDSTDPAHVAVLMNGDRAVLMNTDPTADGGNRKSLERPIENDDMSPFQLRAFLYRWIQASLAAIQANAAIYCWHPAGEPALVVLDVLQEYDILIHRPIVWVKDHMVFGSGDYHMIHESCLYGWQRGNRPPFYGDRNQTTAWAISHDVQGERVHSAQKPVELFARAIRNHCQTGDIVYEPFSGSGSQLIAGQQCGVSVRAMELEPEYVQQAIDRWEAFTGQKAELLSHA